VALAIVHREPGTQPIPPGVPTWRTCLREVEFADDGLHEAALPSGRRLAEGDAYRLLLEVLCGLQSPMVGETQVLGQFKAFLATLDRGHGWLTRLGQRLLTDARDIRTSYLQGLGSRSYGSAVRRHLNGCTHAAIIGTGKLADEVLPFLSDDRRPVDQWSRRDEAIDAIDAASAVTRRLLDRADDAPVSAGRTTLVIAAPISTAVVDRVTARYADLACVIDLRAEADAPLGTTAPVVTLQMLFDEIHASHAGASRLVEAARAEIARRSRLYELREELRPFGWDDLCA
jgi:glutamyl-tRNA reductase